MIEVLRRPVESAQYELIGISAYGQVPAEVKIAYKEGHHRPYVNDVAKYQRVLIRKKD